MNKPLFVATVLSLSVVGLAGCAKKEAPPEPVRAVRTLTVSGSQTLAAYEYAAEIRARTESRLGFRVGGKLQSRSVNLGDSVKVGQVLAQLDGQDLRLGQEAARAAVAAAQTNLDQVTADYKRFKELRDQAHTEGLLGISPRYVQDKISNALVAFPEASSINPFMVMNELEAGLKHHSLINSEETKQEYRELLGIVKEEYTNIVKNEVQRAIAADEAALARLCGNYIDNIKAYTQRERVRNKFTGQMEEPDERLMRSIEEKIDIPESRKDDFRREIMNYIGALAIEGKTFDYKTNERLHKALEL